MTTDLPSPAATTRGPSIPVLPPADLRPLRWLAFLYLGLWVFEGALRKWFLPGLANPLLIVRDPVLLTMYALALAKGVFPRNAFVVWIAVIGGSALVVSMGATDAPLMVELYGFRANFLHLPLIFLLPVILRPEDLRTIGKWALVLAAPMAVLVLLQFGSGRGSRLNAGAGAGTTMLESTYGHIRPSGTFSYTNGLGSFTSLTLAFFLYHLLEKRVFPRLLWFAAIPSLVVMVILSGSRGAAGIVGFLLATVLGISAVQTRYRSSAFKLAAVIGIGIFVIGSFAVFKTGVSIFSTRFGSASNVQTGFVGRFFHTFITPYEVSDQIGLGGVGLGMGTNVAAGLLVGKRTFMVAEEEGARVVMESGPLVGTAFLLLRWALAIYLGLAAWRALRRHASTLPLLLFSTCFYSIMLGQFAQATELGFATIAAGLCLAASTLAGQPVMVPVRKTVEPAAPPPPSRTPKLEPDPGLPLDSGAMPAPVGTLPRPRGRSSYAERLHRASTEDQYAVMPAPESMVRSRVLLVGNYLPDGQESMLRFARMMLDGLRARGQDVELVSPGAFFGGRLPSTHGLGKWLAYLDKFVLFPWTLRRRVRALGPGAVVQICDHSNAMYVPAAPARGIRCSWCVMTWARSGARWARRPMCLPRAWVGCFSVGSPNRSGARP